MTEYNPFGKPFTEVTIEDIYDLDVPEGYYYEYKRSMIHKEDIAKSISSFANTYGGILFLGIEEDASTNKPAEWFTLNSGDPTKYKETIRNVIKEYINPNPRFTTHSFSTSSSDGAEQYVILVEIPKSTTTPHINNDGKIYRRTGEGSDPYKPLENPGILDDLYTRKKEWEDEVNRFCQLDVSLTNAQSGNPDENISGNPLLELYAIPTTLNERVCESVILEIDRFKDIVQSSEVPLADSSEEDSFSIGIPADTYRGISDGVVAQQWTTRDSQGGMDKAHTPLTIRFFIDGSAKFYVPLPSVQYPGQSGQSKTWNLIREELKEPSRRRELKEIERNDIEFISGKETVGILFTLLNTYFELLNEYNWPEESNTIYVRSRTRNMFRKMLFFDRKWYQELIEKYGLPICYEDTVESPRVDPFQCEVRPAREDRMKEVWTPIRTIFESMGLPLESLTNLSGELIEHFEHQSDEQGDYLK